MYKITLKGTVKKQLDDDSWVEFVPNNDIDPLSVAYDTWLADGNTPDYEASVEELRRARQDEVNAHRATLLGQPVSYDGNSFDNDADSRPALTAAHAMMGASDTVTWRTSDNVNVTLDKADIQLLLAAGFAQESAIYAVSWVHKDAIEALTDKAAIAAYDYSTGW